MALTEFFCGRISSAVAWPHDFAAPRSSLPVLLLSARVSPLPVVPCREGFSFLIEFMRPTLMAQLDQAKSTELHPTQREIPILGITKAPEEVDWALIAKCNDEQDALLLCVHLSRLSNEEIARRLSIDKSHWTRIMQGRGNLPARKRTPLMSICGNIAPIQFEAMRFGRQLKEHDLEREEKEAQERLARVQAQKRVMALAA